MQRNENDFSCCEIGLECRFLHLLHLLLVIHYKKYSADFITSTGSWKTAVIVTRFLLLTNSCMNPIIYSKIFRTGDMDEESRTVLPC